MPSSIVAVTSYGPTCVGTYALVSVTPVPPLSLAATPSAPTTFTFDHVTDLLATSVIESTFGTVMPSSGDEATSFGGVATPADPAEPVAALPPVRLLTWAPMKLSARFLSVSTSASWSGFA